MKSMDTVVVGVEFEIGHGEILYKLLSGEPRRRLAFVPVDIEVVEHILAVVIVILTSVEAE